MTDAAHAYAQWRLDNPSSVGWPQEAFMAGWEAKGNLNMVTPMMGQPLMIGVDRADDAVIIVLMRRNESGIIEVLAEKMVELPEKLKPERPRDPEGEAAYLRKFS